jgi:hypothetical protein
VRVTQKGEYTVKVVVDAGPIGQITAEKKLTVH